MKLSFSVARFGCRGPRASALDDIAWCVGVHGTLLSSRGKIKISNFPYNYMRGIINVRNTIAMVCWVFVTIAVAIEKGASAIGCFFSP